MIQKYALVCLAFFAFVTSGFGQVTIFSENIGTSTAGTTSIAANVFQNSGTLTFTGDADTRNNTFSAGYTGASGGRNVFITNTSGRYITISGINTSNHTNLGLSFGFWKSSAAAATVNSSQFVVEVATNYNTTTNTGTFTQLGYATVTSGSAWSLVTINSGTIPSSATLAIRFRQNQTTAQFRIDDIILRGELASVDAPDWCNIQFPTASPQTITEGDNFDVYARAYEPGVTESAGQGAGLLAWIGYNTVNNNPNDASWTWVPATFNVQAGNDDEFDAEIGSGLTPNTYYYASRFQLNGGPFVYGGTGGIWNNDSVQLNVIADQVDFCNVDFPKTGTINQGDNFNVFAQAYEPGVTDAAGQGANIEAWIGYTTNGVNYEPWLATGWTWVAATYDSDFGNNDNYRAQIGSTLPVGTYYYASRFRLNGSSEFSYGGIQNDNQGSFWNIGTFNNGILTVNTPPIADVVITEIMYNSAGTDDEWIEICNISGSTQNLSNYTVRLGGVTRFTFPIGTNILNGQCITVSLGSNGDGTYNNPCPFIPDFGVGAGTNNTNILPNGTGPYTITLVAANGTDIADTVVYGSGDGANGNNSTLHVTNILLDNSDAGTNWQEVLIGGSPGVNSLTSPCSIPELQLVDSSNTDQTCGTFSINFGSQATSFNTDITFDIDNDGSSSLTISSFDITGVNPGDFSIVSPATPFTITAGNTQTVTVRFIPSTLGARSATLTVNNNDSDEGSCDVLLNGNGITPAPNIRVERNTEALIANGAAANGGNNTIFATTDLGDTTAPKLYYVRNGNTANPATADLTVNTITSSNNAEFTLVNVPTLPITLAPDEFISFEIEFSPNSTTPLTRNGTITITSNDTTDNPYTFGVQGTAGCPIYNGAITPTSGPVGTEVTITSAENLTGATATLNGVPLTTVSSSTGELVVQVPLTVTLGGALTVQLSNGCSFTNTFTLIDEAIQSCEGNGSAPSGLFISQVTDSPTGSLTYIELYNATVSAIDFAVTNHSLRIYNNGSTTTFSNIPLTNGTIAQNSTYVVAIGTNDSQCTVAGGNGGLAQLMIATPGVSINFHKSDDVTLGHDFIGLYNSSAILTDAFGTFGDESWAVGLNLDTSGANFTRNTDATLPNTTFSTSDWDIINWENCAGADYSDIGGYDFSVGTPPSVSVLTVPTSNCDLTAILTVTGTEGFDGAGDSQELAYQWYYSAPGELGWTTVVNNAVYSGATTNTLEILNTLTLNGYQYYCQVREDDATCYTASNAVKLTLNLKTWNGSVSNDWTEDANWTPFGLPSVNDIVVVPSGGNPIIIGSPPFPPTVPLYAKSLIISSGATLEIPIGKNLIVENCIVNHGTIDLKNAANLIQINETDQNSGDGNFFMERIVNDVESLNYIYWSTPIDGFDMSGIPGSNAHRYYWSPTAINANNTQGDWIQTTGVMARGTGYIIRVAGATPNLNVTLGGNNLGTPHNGTFTTPISKGSYVYSDPADNINNYYNLIGNPYPSAISADAFINVNAAQLMDDDLNPAVLGTIYLWRHQAAPNETIDDPFYENFASNYDGSNYVAYNATGATPANGFDGNIASGQAFFVLMDETTTNTNVSFTNAMRYGDPVTDAYDNGQFLRAAPLNQDNQSTNTIERHRIWLDLIAPNNTSVSTLIGYVTGATNAKDRLFDGHETNATGLGFYSIVGYDRMGIQGRKLPFDENDTVPLGVNLLQTGTYTIAINQVDGLFLGGQHIFLEDTYTNTIHNMRTTPYTFYSTGGTFNNRFTLRYTNSTLSIPDIATDAGLSITELPNGHVKFTVGHNLTIQSVEIYDMLGRQLYNLPGSNAFEVYNLANLSQATYVAKVTLSNGQTVTKRAVKRK